jgi:nitrite reductase/ring-hydroxylating ferredoxin subunit
VRPVRIDPGPQSGGGLGRRDVFRALALVATGWLAWAWHALARGRRRETRVTLPRPAGEGVSVHGEVVLVNAGGKLSAFHARCPHLGCTVARVDDASLACPCHGSRFDAAGRRLGGPAPSDLRPLKLSPSKREHEVDVDLPA